MVILIYIPSLNSIILIYYKIYIINDLSVKVLISIDIIKPKGIVLDTNKDLTIIGSYKSL